MFITHLYQLVICKLYLYIIYPLKKELNEHVDITCLIMFNGPSVHGRNAAQLLTMQLGRISAI
jgi:hypothetical protein